MLERLLAELKILVKNPELHKERLAEIVEQIDRVERILGAVRNDN